jgi:hypothetical protein
VASHPPLTRADRAVDVEHLEQQLQAGAADVDDGSRAAVDSGRPAAVRASITARGLLLGGIDTLAK